MHDTLRRAAAFAVSASMVLGLVPCAAFAEEAEGGALVALEQVVEDEGLVQGDEEQAAPEAPATDEEQGEAEDELDVADLEAEVEAALSEGDQAASEEAAASAEAEQEAAAAEQAEEVPAEDKQATDAADKGLAEKALEGAEDALEAAATQAYTIYDCLFSPRVASYTKLNTRAFLVSGVNDISKISWNVTCEGKELKAGSDYKVSTPYGVRENVYNLSLGRIDAILYLLQQDGDYGVSRTVGAWIYQYHKFDDVASNAWYSQVVGRATALDLIHGYSNSNNFGPNDKIQRAQVCVILKNMAGNVKTGSHKNFSDVKGSEYYGPAVYWASSAGIVSGYKSGKFGPKDNVTREQLAVMLYNYAKKYRGMSIKGSAADYAGMKDAKSVSNYASAAVGWCFKNGIMSGTNDGKINPKGNATRAEAAKMIIALYDYVN